MKAIMPIMLATSVLLTGCNSVQRINLKDQDIFTPRAEQPDLLELQAAYRARQLSNVDYQLAFDLSENETFHGQANISFNLLQSKYPITIDLDKAELKSVKINGNVVEPQYNQAFITLQPQYLHQGNNRIEIDYQRLHSTNGEGLHRFKDPVDGKVYLYSHFEPAAAKQMFPSFDQPDLKASYELSVTAPQDWQVISAEPESSATVITTADGSQKKHWIFAKTPKLSTYNFSLHAGPYHMWQDNTGKYPARLFARQSVAAQVSPPMWFKFTKQGFAFFEDYFGIDYPFKKYDQILVPDFLYGAMENAAAVTFDERSFLSGGEMSLAQQEGLAQTILHEMAHQWFGDLVTMKWWNGLWLNESFASFMTYLSTAEATQFDYAWRTFYMSRKQSAYFADQLVTTHPIEVPVPSTANAFDNIDAITYAKGASVLRQLNFLLGPEVFRQGVHNYLTKYAYSNATLDDFINSLSKTANRDLSQWKQQWLYQPGVNTITAQYQCEKGKVSAFNIKQSMPKDYPVLREQRVNIGLFNLDSNGVLSESQAEPVTYIGENTQVKSLIGAQCPDLVYPNYQDWGFVKINLDEKSFATVKANISGVSDPFLRSMLWQSLQDSVSDGLLPLNEYIEVLLSNIGKEQDYTLLRQLTSGARQAVGFLNQFDNSVAAYREQTLAKLEAIAWQAVQDNADKPNNLRTWFQFYRYNARSEQALQRLVDILNGKITVKNLELSQEIRWSLVQHLNQYDYQGSLALIDSELARDNSDAGQKQAIAARAGRPNLVEKQYWLDQFAATNPEHPFPKLRAAMGSLFPSSQAYLQEQFADQILASLSAIDKAKGPVFMRSYARAMIPATCTGTNQIRLENAKKTQTDLSTVTHRNLLLAEYFNQQCLKVFEHLNL